MARIGLPVGGAQDLHRALLGAFLAEADPPDLAVIGRLAVGLQVEPQAVLAVLAAADLVHADPVTGRVRVAYPFSGRPTAHRVELTAGRTLYAMCALDALGIPQMTRRGGRISSADPTSGQPITVEVDGQGWRWQPPTAVVLVGTATIGGAGGSVADCCCPSINFHASPRDADSYRQAHPNMTAELLDQAEAVAAAERSFGGLLHPDSGRRGDRHGND